MTITIDISKTAESRLRERAGLSGKPVEVFVRELVERDAAEPTWDELVAPLHEETKRLGITEAELDEFINAELADVRRQRRLLAK